MNGTGRTFTCFGLSLFAFLPIVQADVLTIQLAPQAKTNSIDSIADQTHGFMKWSNGAFIYQDSGVAGLAPTFYTLDREGTFVSSANLKVPDGDSVWPGGLDRASDGTIVFSGGAYSSSGEEAPFIEFISPDTRAVTIVRTAPYYPYSVSFAPDGTIWTIGLEMINHDPKAVGLDPNAGVLRHYDRAGKLLASGIQQSQFAESKETRRLLSGRLIAKNDRIGWISGLAGDGVYHEISPSTLTVTRTVNAPVREGYRNLINGFTLTDSGQVFLEYESHKDGHGSRIAYALDQKSGLWSTLAVPILDGTQFTPYLMGSDGEQLVFQYGQSAAFFRASK